MRGRGIQLNSPSEVSRSINLTRLHCVGLARANRFGFRLRKRWCKCERPHPRARAAARPLRRQKRSRVDTNAVVLAGARDAAPRVPAVAEPLPPPKRESFAAHFRYQMVAHF